MDEEEKANKPVSSDQNVHPTPSKLLASQISDFHVLTPIKNEDTPVAIRKESISFDLDKAANSDLKGTDSKGNSDKKASQSQEVSSHGNNENIVSGSGSCGSLDDRTKSSKKEGEEKASSGSVSQVRSSNLRNRQGRAARRVEQPSNGTDDDGIQCRLNDASRKRTRQTSVSSGTASPSNRKKRVFEVELDQEVLDRRQKQIDFGKNTIGYERYLAQVPKNKRTARHPSTPPMNQKYSRRAWDGLIKIWRQQLHFWDPEPAESGNGADSESESNENNSLDESLLLTD